MVDRWQDCHGEAKLLMAFGKQSMEQHHWEKSEETGVVPRVMPLRPTSHTQKCVPPVPYMTPKPIKLMQSSLTFTRGKITTVSRSLLLFNKIDNKLVPIYMLLIFMDSHCSPIQSALLVYTKHNWFLIFCIHYHIHHPCILYLIISVNFTYLWLYTPNRQKTCC